MCTDQYVVDIGISIYAFKIITALNKREWMKAYTCTVVWSGLPIS